jgi:hypothetical protein
LKATAERWKRDGFDLFEKGSSSGGSSSRALSGSQSIEHQVGSQDMGGTSANTTRWNQIMTVIMSSNHLKGRKRNIQTSE